MMLTEIYRSGKREGMYLYVEKGKDLTELPEALLKQFGRAELAMTLVLSATKKLANADVETVMAQLQSQGYYLQMPPTGILGEAYMQQVRNEKMPLT